MTPYFKHKNCMNWGKSFFCPMDKKRNSPYTEWCIGKCPVLCTFVFKTSTWHLKCMLYHAVVNMFWDTCIFSTIMPKLLPGALIKIINPPLPWTSLFCRGWRSSSCPGVRSIHGGTGAARRTGLNDDTNSLYKPLKPVLVSTPNGQSPGASLSKSKTPHSCLIRPITWWKRNKVSDNWIIIY